MTDLNDTTIFVAVVRAGSLTAAARELGMPVSTVSRKLVALERRLGVRLLERTARRFALTEAGTLYHERSAGALAELERAEAAVRELRAVPRGVLRVTMPPEFSALYLDRAVVRFMATYPDVRVEARLDQARADLVRDRFDVAIRIGPLDDSSLVARKIGHGARRLVASPAYLASRGAPAHPRELADHDCLLHGALRAAAWRFRDRGAPVAARVTGRLVANSYSMLAAAARAGLGIALLPLRMCADDLEHRRLVSVLDAFLGDEVGIYAVYPSSAHPPAKLTRFLDILAGVMAAPGA